jgi:hypothetical protein
MVEGEAGGAGEEDVDAVPSTSIAPRQQLHAVGSSHQSGGLPSSSGSGSNPGPQQPHSQGSFPVAAGAAGGGSVDVAAGLARQVWPGKETPAAAARAMGSTAVLVATGVPEAPAPAFAAGFRSSSASSAAGVPAGHARQSTAGGGGAGEAAEVVFLRQELEAMRSRLQTSEGEASYLRSRTETVSAPLQRSMQQQGAAQHLPSLALRKRACLGCCDRPAACTGCIALLLHCAATLC